MIGMVSRSTSRGWPARLGAFCALGFALLTQPVAAQDDDDSESEESSFTINAMMKMQGGLFVPLASDGFQPQHNSANLLVGNLVSGSCDPVIIPGKPCYP